MTKDTKERATFLIGAAMILGFAFTLLGKQNSKEENKTQNQVTLVVATDLHYLAPTLTDGGEFFRQYIENGDGKVIPYCEEITEAFVEQVIAEKPNAVILSGDLTFNGENESHIALAEKLARIEEKGIPVYVLPGNHDLKNAKAASFQGDSYSFVESIDALEFTEAYKEFEEKSKDWTEDTTKTIADDFMKMFVVFGSMKEKDPADSDVQEQVKRLQAYITEHFYQCTSEILSCLGHMYSGGGEYTENIDKAGGAGTADFTARAIEIYCGK